MTKIYQILLVLLLAQASLYAQQLPLFSQYRQNMGLINPAAHSSDFLTYDQTVNFGGSFRKQWIGLKNAPTTQVIQGSYLHDSGGMGFLSGGYLINDKTGPTGFTGLYGRFAVVLTDDVYDRGLTLGLNAGIVQYRVDITEIEFLEGGDILAVEDQMQLFPDVGFGIYAYQNISSNGFLDNSKIYAGLSVPQLIGLDLEFKSDNDQFYTRRVQHFYGIAGLIKNLDDDKFIESTAWVKYTINAPVNVDFNIRYKMAQNFWIGAGGSTAKAAHIEAGLLIGEYPGSDNTFTIGYGFDYFFTSFGPATQTSHEFNVSYSF